MKLMPGLNAALLLLFTSCAMPLTAQNPLRQARRTTLVVDPAFQQEFLMRINEIRTRGCNCGKVYMPPVPPLTWNDQLENSAYLHASDMNRKKYFSHISKDGRTSKDRIMAAGYRPEGYKTYAVGENIAWGQRSIREAMEGWLKSEGHCHNIMNKSFREVGVAMENNYWVQNFGGRK
ncbi:CAP domain-containing protein [Arcticibacter sp. MXS-1]|uniref:CAP domain-containing protein n=1 Tax=Arcticibacter sp. MXS-1 TaxID=3341726 RepID=UPI0035A8D33D